MSDSADDRLEHLQNLRDKLDSMNPEQMAKYTRWIQVTQDSGPSLDLKHHLAIATAIAKDLPRHLETDEIKQTISRAAIDQHERDIRRAHEAEQSPRS